MRFQNPYKNNFKMVKVLLWIVKIKIFQMEKRKIYYIKNIPSQAL